MGLTDRARSLFDRGVRKAQFSAITPRPMGAVIQDLIRHGGDIDVEEALSVPAVKRGRDIICGLSGLPLETVDSSLNVVSGTLLDQIDPNVPDVVTISQTLQDLLFHAVSWWLITEFDADGWPLHARHLDFKQVTVTPRLGTIPAPLPSGLDPRGEILVDGQPISIELLIKFDSVNTPLLRDGARSLKLAVILDRLAQDYAENPRPAAFLAPADPKEGDPFKDNSEAQEALDDLKLAAQRGDTIYIPAAVLYNVVQQPTPVETQLVQRQQRAALDIANTIGLDPEDLGVSTTSRTYQNAVDRRQDRINDVLRAYASAITSRLSMPDVTRPGQKVRFDWDDYLRADPKTRAEVQQIYQAMGVVTVDEIRAEEGRPALDPQQRRQLEAIKVQATVGQPVPAIEGASNAGN